MRDASDDEIVVDLESVVVNGRRYTVSTPSETVTAEGQGKEGVGANSRTGKYVGGGAIIGSIIGAIAGGGKGAAIGAATGAGAGAVRLNRQTRRQGCTAFRVITDLPLGSSVDHRLR